MGTKTNDPYFDWMCKKVGVGGTDGRPYILLLRELHNIRFITRNMHPMDINRMYDGLELRRQFMKKYGEVGTSTNRGSCTMLEFLVALAGKMSFLMGSEAEESKRPDYFLQLIRNLRLLKLTDDRFDILHGDFHVDDAAHRIMNRLYSADGDGGLFPLRKPTVDQRTIEIWAQMHAWLSEHCAIAIDIE